MKFMLLMLPTVPGTLEDRKRLRPIGRNNERYPQMLDVPMGFAVLNPILRLTALNSTKANRGGRK
jgi:hypothetical protein